MKHQPVRQGQTTTPGTSCPTLFDKCVGSLTSPANHVHYISPETSYSAEECEHEKHGHEDEVDNSEEYEGIFEGSGEEMYSSPINSSVESIASPSYHDTPFNSDVEGSSSNASTDHTTDIDLEPTSAVSDTDLSSLETESDVETDVRSRLPLYEGSSKTVLETLGGYFYWFSSHPSISKNALSSLLYHEHYNVLPEGNNLPSSYVQAYDFIKPNLLPTECYHACPNDCILFRKTDRFDYSALKNCPKCNGDRYTSNGKPVRRFFFIIPLVHALRDYMTAEKLRVCYRNIHCGLEQV